MRDGETGREGLRMREIEREEERDYERGKMGRYWRKE